MSQSCPKRFSVCVCVCLWRGEGGWGGGRLSQEVLMMCFGEARFADTVHLDKQDER